MTDPITTVMRLLDPHIEATLRLLGIDDTGARLLALSVAALFLAIALLRALATRSRLRRPVLSARERAHLRRMRHQRTPGAMH